MPSPLSATPSLGARAGRALWVVAGTLALLAGVVGIFLPLLPTVPFVLLAAFCFSRGCRRCEQWLLEHPRFGPALRNWRAHRALTLRSKQAATSMMAISAALAWWVLPSPVRWLPAVVCIAVAWWLWRLPTRLPDPP